MPSTVNNKIFNYWTPECATECGKWQSHQAFFVIVYCYASNPNACRSTLRNVVNDDRVRHPSSSYLMPQTIFSGLCISQAVATKLRNFPPALKQWLRKSIAFSAFARARYRILCIIWVPTTPNLYKTKFSVFLFCSKN